MEANCHHDANTEGYLEYLPAIFRQDGAGDSLREFLKAFEHVLTGIGTVELDADGHIESDPKQGTVVGLEEMLDGVVGADGLDLLAGIHRYFDPGPNRSPAERAPKDFLNWLAGWVALSLRAGLDEQRWREFIDRAAYLYRWRGTKRSLGQLINIYTQSAVTISDEVAAFQIGAHSTIGKDSILGGRPHFFTVEAQIEKASPQEEIWHGKVIRAIIEMEKPAHTYYELRMTGSVRMQIAIHSTIGKDTILGT